MAKSKTESAENTTKNTSENTTEKKAGKVSMVRCLKGNILKEMQLGESYTVTGACKKYEVGNSNFGEFVKFNGSFAIKFREDIYTSANLILPKVAEDLLRIEMDKLAESDATEFQFMLVIGKEEKPKRTPIDCGYEWTCAFPETVKIAVPTNPFVQLLLEV